MRKCYHFYLWSAIVRYQVLAGSGLVPKVRVMVQVDAEMLAAVDARCAALGMSRAEWSRRAWLASLERQVGVVAPVGELRAEPAEDFA